MLWSVGLVISVWKTKTCWENLCFKVSGVNLSDLCHLYQVRELRSSHWTPCILHIMRLRQRFYLPRGVTNRYMRSFIPSAVAFWNKVIWSVTSCGCETVLPFLLFPFLIYLLILFSSADLCDSLVKGDTLTTVALACVLICVGMYILFGLSFLLIFSYWLLTTVCKPNCLILFCYLIHQNYIMSHNSSPVHPALFTKVFSAILPSSVWSLKSFPVESGKI